MKNGGGDGHESAAGRYQLALWPLSGAGSTSTIGGQQPRDRTAQALRMTEAAVDFDDAPRRDDGFAYAQWGRGHALDGIRSFRAATDAFDQAAASIISKT